MEEIQKIFKDLEDPRDNRGKRHLLMDIIVITVCGIICGCVDFDEIADYAKDKMEFFSEHLLLWNGLPKAKTYREVFKVINVSQFLECFLIWVKSVVAETIGRHIIIDGKAIRSATEKVVKGNVPYIVNAYLAGVGITIGQIKVGEKTNEIKAIPKILELVAVKGAIITIDAMVTQEEIMNEIISYEADFILPVKGNQENTYEGLKEYFEQEYLEENNVQVDRSQTTYNNEHGRIETRRSVISTEVEWFNDIKKWQHVKMIGMTINTREIAGVKSEQIKYYVSSKVLDADEFNAIVRNHWQIENNLHWTLDVVFKEDLSRGRKGNLMENFSLVRKFCLNIIKLDNRFGKMSIKRKMKKYDHDENSLKDLHFRVLPTMKKA